MMRTSFASVALCLGLLSACSSEAPLAPYPLTAAAPAPAKRPFAVSVDAPTVAANLDSERILVKDHGEPLVLADARWPQPLPAMVAARISDALASPEGPARIRLSLDIRRFELIAERKTVVIVIDATALDATGARPLRHRAFSASVSVPTTKPQDVVAGFDRAFAGVQRRLAAFAYDP